MDVTRILVASQEKSALVQRLTDISGVTSPLHRKRGVRVHWRALDTFRDTCTLLWASCSHFSDYYIATPFQYFRMSVTGVTDMLRTCYLHAFLEFRLDGAYSYMSAQLDSTTILPFSRVQSKSASIRSEHSTFSITTCPRLIYAAHSNWIYSQ